MMTKPDSADVEFLRRAVELAERGRGLVEPNPLVGAVVVRDGQIVGEGWHARFGGPHAEVVALDRAGAKARGAALYTSLEPCCHHGKTPPCTERIIAAGICRVVAAMQDPFTQVAGNGLHALREAGLEVPPCPGPPSQIDADARRLNAPYLKLLATGLPYVHAKWAMTLDGKIATAAGDSKWISGEASRRCVHELRGKVDAVLVGLGTVRADDPMLTARPPGPRVAARVVLDSRARLGSHTQLVRTAREVPVIVATTPAAPTREIERLEAAGCECLVLTAERAGAANSSLEQSAEHTPIVPLLEALGKRRMTNVLVEGGSAVLGSFFAARQIDVAHVFVAPKLVGGTAAKSPLGGAGLTRVALAPQLEIREVTPIGPDVYLRAEMPPPPPSEHNRHN